MHAQVVEPNGLFRYVVPIAVLALVFAFRARRMSRVRPLRPGELWIVPVGYLVIVGASLVATPPAAAGWAALVVGGLLGAALGWWRGGTVAIHVDPATGTLQQRGSPVALLVVLFLAIAKSALRAGGGAAHLNVALLTDALLGVAVGTVVAMRAEMFVRARRLLAAHARDQA